MSLWEHVEIITSEVSAADIGRSLRSLHDAMARYCGALPPRSAVLEEIDWLLTALAEHCADAALIEERDRLAPLMLQVDAAGQPLHGDASLSNLLSTSAGPRWNDFEDVCFGSPVWDVVGLLDDAREHHGDAFAAELLAAYEQDVDPALIPLVRGAQTLYGTLWQRYRAVVPGAQG